MDLDLGPQRVLALDDSPRDQLGQSFDEEGVAYDELVDGLLEEFREARHMHALAGGVQVDGARDLRGYEDLAGGGALADGLVHAPNADARQPDADLGLGGLEVGEPRPVLHGYSSSVPHSSPLSADSLPSSSPSVPSSSSEKRPVKSSRTSVKWLSLASVNFSWPWSVSTA